MNILIIGCGKTGRRLARDLVQRGYGVSVVDKNKENLEKLGDNFPGLVVMGEPIDKDVLVNAGAENVDVVAVLTHDDNVNVMVAQTMMLEFNVKNIYTRVLDPAREAVFKTAKFGLHTICATRYESDHLLALIAELDAEIKASDIDGIALEFETLKTDRKEWGKPISKIKLRSNETLIAVKRDGRVIPASSGDLTIEEGDKIVLGVFAL